MGKVVKVAFLVIIIMQLSLFWFYVTTEKKTESKTPPKAIVRQSRSRLYFWELMEYLLTVQGQAKEKPYFFRGGVPFPSSNNKTPSRLFPEQDDGDRIIEQLTYIPEDYKEYSAPVKVVLVSSLDEWQLQGGSSAFNGCPVSRCSVTEDYDKAATVDAILFKDNSDIPNVKRPINQIWIMFFLESPYNTRATQFSNLINWTATYRRDSDLVTPYERWTYYEPEVRQLPQTRDYSANKTRKVAWFVSNCRTRNRRLAYANKLAKHISVDIYGKCGRLKCPPVANNQCLDILDRYKFYLAFENSNCRDYITEKFFVNGLGRNVLPIVMGARLEDYRRSAPEQSFIHVDEFDGPKELGAYLRRLDEDDAAYNAYFRWKGTGEFINTFFWCRLCAMLHAPVTRRRNYKDITVWWEGHGVCTYNSWRNRR